MISKKVFIATTLLATSFFACTKSDNIDTSLKTVYEEDFNGNSGMWIGTTTDGFTASEQNGRYIMTLPTQIKHKSVPLRPENLFSGNERRQVVELHLQTTQGDGAATLIFAGKTGKDRLSLYLSPKTGKYALSQNLKDNGSLDLQDWTDHSGITYEPIVLRIELKSGVLTISVNGSKLYTGNISGINSLDHVEPGIAMWEGNKTTTVEIDKILALAAE